MQRSLLSYMRKLRNHEFAEAYSLIASNVGLEELEADYLSQAVDNVKGYAKNLTYLRNLKRRHPITEQIDLLKNERHQYLLSIRGRVAYYMKSPMKDEQVAAKRLSVWLSAYHEFFKGARIHAQSNLVDNMCDEIETTEAIQGPIEELGLIYTIQTIQAITSNIRRLHLQRLQEVKEESAQAKHIRDTAFAHIATLWKSLEVSTSLNTHDGALCRSLFESINWVIIDFKAKYLDKVTRRENEKLKEEQKGEQPEPETDPEPE